MLAGQIETPVVKKPEKVRRQIFVLTPDEKKAVACVLAALLLGLGTKHYRSTHPRPAPAPTAREQHAAQKSAKAAAARARSARGQAETARVAPTAASEDDSD